MILCRVATRRQYQAGAISLKRVLNGPGEILVQPGQWVMPADAIGHITTSPNLFVVDVVAALRLHHSTTNIQPYLLKTLGDSFNKDDVLAEYKGRISVMERRFHAPVSGKFIAVEGPWLLLEAETKTEPLNALISGRVTAVTPTKSAVIETYGCYIEATLGFGGECHGLLHSISDDSQADISLDIVEQIQQPSVLMAGGTILPEAIAALPDSVIVGVIVGSVNASILAEKFQPPVPIIATEGIGTNPMFVDTWQLLHNRHQALVSAVAPISVAQARQLGRALIMVPQPEAEVEGLPRKQQTAYVSMATIGDRIRNIREPHSMAWGRLAVIQDQPQQTLAKTPYLGADVLLADEMQFVPWFNLEKIG